MKYFNRYNSFKEITKNLKNSKIKVLGTINHINAYPFFTIEIKNGGVATIENNQGGAANVTTILLLDPIIGNQTKIMLPDSIIRISEPSLNIYKKGTARII